jgi:hypothetical protein
MKQQTMRTMGLGFNMMSAVTLPDLERRNDWIVANARDFHNEVELLYSCVAADGIARFGEDEGAGFPPRFEYRWKRMASKRSVGGGVRGRVQGAR